MFNAVVDSIFPNIVHIDRVNDTPWLGTAAAAAAAKPAQGEPDPGAAPQVAINADRHRRVREGPRPEGARIQGRKPNESHHTLVASLSMTQLERPKFSELGRVTRTRTL